MDQQEESTILTGAKIGQTITRMAHEIVEKNKDLNDFVIIGIKTRGAVLAQRLAKELMGITESERIIPVGALDVSLYRDDFERTGAQLTAETTDIHFSIEDTTVLLVDDVLFTGRTINAAIRALFDMGRPRRIKLAVLIDRGHRELPYRPDYCGKNVPTQYVEKIRVRLKETDDRDVVLSGPGSGGRGKGE
ncbi:MAG: bifunctional pyr operon transcriptional regulator/uracil phosphoribosyltransferase PyrR [Nitrospinae bacterium]|nr:bifunctional pyr operon transcriptional regulator/uracil phosphoribosyltransferase PyrR [Nitrospinota bacterium]